MCHSVQGQRMVEICRVKCHEMYGNLWKLTCKGIKYKTTAPVHCVARKDRQLSCHIVPSCYVGCSWCRMDCQLHGTEHSSRHIDYCSVCFYFASTCSWNFVSLFLNGWLEHLELWSVYVSLLLWDFSARWFVPWLCLPHVYNYRRFLQAKGHRGTSGRHFQSERQDTDGYRWIQYTSRKSRYTN